MQAQVQKKDRQPIIYCPRCHAQNLGVQARCGKCGYVFPLVGAYKGKKRSMMGADAPTPPVVAPRPAPAPGFGGGDAGGSGADGGMGGDPSNPDANPPILPTRPKHIPESGMKEGPLGTRGAHKSCPRCGADLRMDARRCVRCGTKI